MPAPRRWTEDADPTPLMFGGAPVIPRFDLRDRRLAPYWAGVHGLVARIERTGGTEEDLIEAIRNDRQDALTVTVRRTADGIEIEARRK